MQLASFSWFLGLLSLISSVHAITYRGADFSSLVNLENQGIRYRDNGNVQPLERILANYGANLARIRVWTSNDYSQYSLNYALNLAKRAQAAGMDIYVDLHYSDSWADPGKQWIPSSWPKDLAGLNTQIYTYTRDVVRAFQNQGTPIKYIEIGNEINDGMLWPVGRISQNGYGNLSELLHSAAAGVRDASSSVKIMVHLANGWNWSAVNGFFNQIFMPGKFATSDVDVLGFSFYPFYGTSATLNNLRSSLTNIVNKLNKEVMVVEVNWPYYCPDVALSEPGYPTGASGQLSFVNQVRSIVENLPNGRGTGIVYWEPGWIGNAGLGSACWDNILVDGSGNVRSPSFNMFNR
ncbi:arabinogalactan endo-1,4-beta-galactosidase [Coprinopsis cinerea AmutBmut pab1-1]|nr:arabinogalactan endo-1,4-beta-galactosidase [Coprinopsis cinerea AmutBmut pab1-1]